MEDLFRIGVIASTHGLKGEVKVYPTTDDVKRFEVLEKCILRTKQGDILLEKNSCRYFKNMVILSFKGYTDINQIEKYKGCELYVTRENAIALEENEYYIADAIGSDIVTEAGDKLGVLADVMQTGANDVFVVKMKDGKELLLPVIAACVLDMDLENKVITVRLMKGMLD